VNDHPPKSSLQTRSDDKSWWLDSPRNVTHVCYALYAICAALLVAGMFVHQHAHFPIEKLFGFQAWFGFIVFVIVVLAGKQLRIVVKRDEDYYDR